MEILGDIFIKEYRYSEAIDTYTRLLDEFPNNEIYYFYIAQAYLALENYQQAKYYFSKILVFNEENTDVLFILGKISNILEEYNEAEKYLIDSIFKTFYTEFLIAILCIFQIYHS